MKKKVRVYWPVPDRNDVYFQADFLLNPDNLEEYDVLDDGPVSEAGWSTMLHIEAYAEFQPDGVGKFIYDDEYNFRTVEIPFTWEYVVEE